MEFLIYNTLKCIQVRTVHRDRHWGVNILRRDKISAHIRQNFDSELPGPKAFLTASINSG
jgi:hypothetical protein